LARIDGHLLPRIEAIARGRCISIRGSFNPRGVKRRMSNFNVRHRGELLHQMHRCSVRAPGRAGSVRLARQGRRVGVAHAP
jgi:hypothetical protein